MKQSKLDKVADEYLAAGFYEGERQAFIDGFKAGLGYVSLEANGRLKISGDAMNDLFRICTIEK
jgi:hypothetical protein